MSSTYAVHALVHGERRIDDVRLVFNGTLDIWINPLEFRYRPLQFPFADVTPGACGINVHREFECRGRGRITRDEGD